MICKEEVCLWFKSLNGSKRIEVLCCFLNMLLPLEIRFFGNCIENIGRKDYHYLRESECNANDVAYVTTLNDITDKICRSKVVVALALLYSSSRLCANALYRILIKVKLNELVPLLDDNEVKEVILMFTMAINHPAFTHDQKLILRKHLNEFEELINITSKKGENHGNSYQIPSSFSSISQMHMNSYSSTSLSTIPVSTMTTVTSHGSSESLQISTSQATLRFSPNQAFISALDLLDICEKTYRIRVTWITDEQIEIFKTHHDVCSFHNRLLQLFPPEAKVMCPDKFIPELPSITFEIKNDGKDDLTSKMKEYFRQLLIHLPLHLLNSHYVVKFFQPSNETFQNNCTFPENVKLHSFTIYNSNLNDSSIASLKAKSLHNTIQDELIPSNNNTTKDVRSKHDISNNNSISSSSSSSSSSSYESPPASETESHSGSPKPSRVTIKAGNCNVKIHQKDQCKLELQQYNDDLQQELLGEKLQSKEDEELTRLGLNQHSVDVLRKFFDFKSGIPSNGLTNSASNKICSNNKVIVHHNSSSLVKNNYSQINSESSSSSEYSSPPPSPPNSCHIHYSSSDDSLYERGAFSATNFDCQSANTIQKDIQKNKNCQKRIENKNIPVKMKKATTTISVGKEKEISNSIEESKNSHITSMNLPSKHQLSRPNTLPLHCHYLPLSGNGEQDSFQRVSCTFINNEIQSHILSNRSTTASLTHVINSPENEISISSVNAVTSNTSTINSNQMSPKRHLQELTTASRSHQKVPEGVTAQFNSFVPPTVHGSHHLNCTSSSSSSSCVNNVTVNSMCPSPSMSSLVPTTNVTNTITYGCMGYIPQIFPPPIPFLHPHTASQHNGFISPTVPAPSQASNFMYPIQSIFPDLAYTSYHMQTPAPAPHPSSSPPAGFVTFPGNCTYIQGTLPSTNAHIKPLTCYNCGGVGHRGCDCKETQDDIIKSAGQFHLNFIPVSKAVEIH